MGLGFFVSGFFFSFHLIPFLSCDACFLSISLVFPQGVLEISYFYIPYHSLFSSRGILLYPPFFSTVVLVEKLVFALGEIDGLLSVVCLVPFYSIYL